jgi:CRP-like cAMP-binding protein
VEAAIEIVIEPADPVRRTTLPAMAGALRGSAAISGDVKVVWSESDQDRLGPLPEAVQLTIDAGQTRGSDHTAARKITRAVLAGLPAFDVEISVRPSAGRIRVPGSGTGRQDAADHLTTMIDQARGRQDDEPTERIRWAPGSLLHSLSPADRQALLRLGTIRQYGPGDWLLGEGDRTTFAVVILDGYVKVSAVTESGAESLLAIRTAGDVIGELSALDGSPRSATAVAAGAVVGRMLTKPDLDACFRRHPAIAVGFNRAVAAKLRVATRHRVDFRGRDAKERLARVLLELFGDPAGSQRRAREGLLLTQAELAGLIAASESAVHQALRELRDAGAVDTSYRRLTITDVDALRAIASPSG